MKFVALIFFSLLLFSACQKAETQTIPADVKRYELKGKVISVDKLQKRAKIDHEPIPGYMDAMTMEFPIKEDWVWNELQPGAEIRAELVVDNSAKDPYWLEKIGIVAALNPNQTPLPEKISEQIGKEVPNFSLTNQEGKRFSMKDYRGKSLAITFIYRECPLPDYCIKMSQGFSTLAVQLNGTEEFRDKMRLLTISFDPNRDTPAKLKEYGIGYLGNPEKPDFTVWQLAVGTDKEVRAVADFFGLKYEIDENDKTQFNHSLVTAVITHDGKVAKIFNGNRWSPEDLLRELSAAAK